MPDTKHTLPGRDRLLTMLENQVGSAREKGTRLALLVFNLCGFRGINIGYGHEVGDRVLQRAAELIQGVLREKDRLYQIGNDEFAVLLPDIRQPQIAQLAAEKILHTLGDSHRIAGHSMSLAAVCGGALFPDHAGDREELLRMADMALHVARERNLDHAIYDETFLCDEQRGVNMRSDLQQALNDNALLLHYQPQIELRSGVVRGCEALMRWPHPAQGWISPETFITVAERYGLINDLTAWSVHVALREWRQLQALVPGAAISVNLSARLLASGEIVELVRRAMNIWGAGPGSLVLEITESAMMADPGAALSILNRLHGLGVTLSIDDFGTGYSSLAYLKKLPVKELKIDKCFVQQMVKERQDRQIVQSVIDLAHNLGMRVVAEGIEDDETMEMLKAMDCDCGQGYHLARPMPLKEVLQWTARPEEGRATGESVHAAAPRRP